MTTQTVLLNDFKRQWEETGAAVMAAVGQVGQSGWYILGESVARFERMLASRVGLGFAVGCASGLDAIEIALRALALPAGARVLTTPLSAFATTLAIIRAGGVPVFVDVDTRGNVDLDRCERLLEGRRDISFAVPVHLYGHPLNLEHLARIKQRFEIHIVEDCAQAISAGSSGRIAGQVGDLAAFSFYPTKNLGALGDGGAVGGQLEVLRSACQSLRNYGQQARYVHDRLGLNSRLDELQAAVLESAFLPRLSDWTARRRQIAARYRAGLSNPSVRPWPVASDAEPVWHLFPVLVAAGLRQSFQDHLRAVGVQTAIHYPRLIPHQEALRGVTFEVIGELPRAAEIANGEVSLPIHPYLTDDEADRVIAAVNSWSSR
jgi:dTDP-3-amino-3,4,6-trideoxy-alpha-D-glucose transaminase